MRTYLVSLAVAGLTSAVLVAALGNSARDPFLLLGLFGLGAAGERYRVPLADNANVSMSSLACATAAMIGGAQDVMLLAVLLAVAVNLRSNVGPRKTMFNCASYGLSALAFIAVYTGVRGALHSNAWPSIVAAATLGILADFALNAVLVSIAIALDTGTSAYRVFVQKFAWLWPYQLPLGAVASVVATGYASNGALAIPVLALGAVGIHLAVTQYARLLGRYIEDVNATGQRLLVLQEELARMTSGSHEAA